MQLAGIIGDGLPAAGLCADRSFMGLGQSRVVQLVDHMGDHGLHTDRIFHRFGRNDAAAIAAGFIDQTVMDGGDIAFIMRRISHCAIIAFTLINGGHALFALAGEPPFWLFYTLLTLGMMLFGMMGANFSALVLEPAGKRAGTTSALYGSVTAIGGAILGSLIGQSFDGSVFPLLAGMAGLGAMALLVVIITERGRLFGVGEADQDAL